MCTFFLERVAGLSQRVQISPHGTQDPPQMCWEGVMWFLGGGCVAKLYPTDFFHWLCRKIMAIDDFPYVGIDFHGDPNIPMPKGVAYEDIDKNLEFILFLNYLFFVIFDIMK